MPRPCSHWGSSFRGTKVFRKGSPRVTTSLLLLVLELPGIRGERARPRYAPAGDSSTTRSSSWCLSSFKLSPPSAVARSCPRAYLAPHFFFKMEQWLPIPLTGFSVRHMEPRPTGPPSDRFCCLEN